MEFASKHTDNQVFVQPSKQIDNQVLVQQANLLTVQMQVETAHVAPSRHGQTRSVLHSAGRPVMSALINQLLCLHISVSATSPLALSAALLTNCCKKANKKI